MVLKVGGSFLTSTSALLPLTVLSLSLLGMFYGSSPGVAKSGTGVGSVNNRKLTGVSDLRVEGPQRERGAILNLPFYFPFSLSVQDRSFACQWTW